MIVPGRLRSFFCRIIYRGQRIRIAINVLDQLSPVSPVSPVDGPPKLGIPSSCQARCQANKKLSVYTKDAALRTRMDPMRGGPKVLLAIEGMRVRRAASFVQRQSLKYRFTGDLLVGACEGVNQPQRLKVPGTPGTPGTTSAKALLSIGFSCPRSMCLHRGQKELHRGQGGLQ